MLRPCTLFFRRHFSRLHLVVHTARLLLEKHHCTGFYTTGMRRTCECTVPHRCAASHHALHTQATVSSRLPTTYILINPECHAQERYCRAHACGRGGQGFSSSQARCMLCCQETSGAPERGPSEEYEESAGTNSAWCTGTPRARSTSDSGRSSRAGSRSCSAAPHSPHSLPIITREQFGHLKPFGAFHSAPYIAPRSRRWLW